MKKLFVGGLPFEFAENDLSDLFAEFSPASAIIIKDKFTGRSKGFGFVEVDDAQLEPAVAKLNGTDVQGRKLTVNEARPMTERPAGFGGRPPRSGGFGGGNRGGGFGGGKRGGRY